jgi:hypothetical protein
MDENLLDHFAEDEAARRRIWEVALEAESEAGRVERGRRSEEDAVGRMEETVELGNHGKTKFPDRGQRRNSRIYKTLRFPKGNLPTKKLLIY